MKRSYLRWPVAALLIALLAAAAIPTSLSAQARAAAADFDCTNPAVKVPAAECWALVALYNSTDGLNWIEHRGWLDYPNPCDWAYVGCFAGGEHVATIYLVGNHLNGSIPPELSQLAYMQRLNLDNNLLTGSIPAQLGDLAEARQLSLASNLLAGGIPPELGKAGKLETLNLAYNRLSGRVPQELGQLASLQYLYLNANQLAGPLPQALTNLTKLFSFNYDASLLCAPDNAAFRTWLSGLRSKPDGTTCKQLHLPVVRSH